MPQFYNIKSYQEGDTFPSAYGELKTYWLEIEGVTGTIRTNKKPNNTPKLGMQYGTLETKTNQKGGTYYNFKSEKVPDGVATPATPKASAPVDTGLAQKVADLEIRVSALENGKAITEDAVADAIEEVKEDKGELSKEELEDIFGGEVDIQPLDK